jgi:hypothetical protein
MSGEEGRGLAKNGRPMAVAFVKVRGPQQYYSEDLVLAEAMGGFAEGVVCVTSVVLHIWTGSKKKRLPIMVLE